MMNNIKNTMCRLSDLTQEQIDSLLYIMPYGRFDFSAGEPYIGVTESGGWGTWAGATKPTIILYSNMMQLLKGKDMNKQTAQEQIAVMQIEMDKLKAIIDKPEVKTGRVMHSDELRNGVIYYTIKSAVHTYSFSNDSLDNKHILLGTAFHDKETAEQYLEYLKLEQELRRAQAADGGTRSCKKYTVIINNTDGRLYTPKPVVFHEKISFNTEGARDRFRNTHTDEQLTLLIRGV
jgi:hypothetical protein